MSFNPVFTSHINSTAQIKPTEIARMNAKASSEKSFDYSGAQAKPQSVVNASGSIGANIDIKV